MEKREKQNKLLLENILEDLFDLWQENALDKKRFNELGDIVHKLQEFYLQNYHKHE